MRRRRAMGMGVAVVMMAVVVGVRVGHLGMLYYNITGVHVVRIDRNGLRPSARTRGGRQTTSANDR